MCVGVLVSVHNCMFSCPPTHTTPALPAVDCSICVCLLCPAANVCPGPLVAILGQTQAAVRCETVVDLAAQVIVSGWLRKVSVQQGQVTNTWS